MIRHQNGDLNFNDRWKIFPKLHVISNSFIAGVQNESYIAFLVTIDVPLSFAGSHATYLATLFLDLTSAPPTFLSKICNP